MSTNTEWSDDLRDFIGSVEWIFAKTYAETWPHYYIVKGRVDGGLFERVVEHIRSYGYEGRFYSRVITYFRDGDMVYWTMVPPAGDPDWYPVEDETIVNRCAFESTYEYRAERGQLP